MNQRHDLHYLITPRLSIVRADFPVLEAILRGNGPLSAFLGTHVDKNWNGFGNKVFEYVTDKLNDAPSDAAWWSYLCIDKGTNTLVGNGGYKGPPSESAVEIGYEIAPSFRGNGLATEFAGALVKNAFTDQRVTRVFAHTLSTRNASTRVLEKCGFNWVEELIDSEEGGIWRWSLEREDWPELEV